MKRTRNGILIPDVPIMAGGNLPIAVKGVSAGGAKWKKHAVDMGLPSGTLWADCDIDVNMPDGFCDTPFTYNKSYFSWGNTDGYNPVGGSFAGVYNWGGVNAAEPWYDGQPYGSTPGSTLTNSIPVGNEFDAACAILGDPWRMPSTADFGELIDNCIFIDANGVEVTSLDKRVTLNGVVGIYLQSKINGARLFFAASGFGSDQELLAIATNGIFWTNSIQNKKNANYFTFSEIGEGINQNSRFYGINIRPITKINAN